jgi:isopenicillin N synthase-like dioxygenase
LALVKMVSAKLPKMSIPVLDLAHADNPAERQQLLAQLRDILFNIGFLYVKNHRVKESTISALTDRLPALFDLSSEQKQSLSKLNSPHFLGYNGFAEETTLGRKDLREQFDYATELPAVWHSESNRAGSTAAPEGNFSEQFWRLRGPNQWPPEIEMPGFKEALTSYHDAVEELSYRFVHLVEEAFDIPRGTFDHFFRQGSIRCPQHRIKLLKYPALGVDANDSQGVGPHKDSSGWLTFLYQVGKEPGLEVLSRDGAWIPAPPIDGTLVVNFGNAFEVATEGAVRATVHRVHGSRKADRYSIPFFMGLPLDLKLSDIQQHIPLRVRQMKKLAMSDEEEKIQTFVDPRWDSLGESQLRKWIKSHKDVGLKWYGKDLVEYYQ